jgi:hypothetical protein
MPAAQVRAQYLNQAQRRRGADADQGHRPQKQPRAGSVSARAPADAEVRVRRVRGCNGSAQNGQSTSLTKRQPVWTAAPLAAPDDAPFAGPGAWQPTCVGARP